MSTKIIIGERNNNIISLNDVASDQAIFAVKDGKIVGMINNDSAIYNKHNKSWILRLNQDSGAYGFFDTLESCINIGIEMGFTFHIDIEI
jgi:hypothetical protein